MGHTCYRLATTDPWTTFTSTIGIVRARTAVLVLMKSNQRLELSSHNGHPTRIPVEAKWICPPLNRQKTNLHAYPTNLDISNSKTWSLSCPIQSVSPELSSTSGRLVTILMKKTTSVLTSLNADAAALSILPVWPPTTNNQALLLPRWGKIFFYTVSPFAVSSVSLLLLRRARVRFATVPVLSYGALAAFYLVLEKVVAFYVNLILLNLIPSTPLYIHPTFAVLICFDCVTQDCPSRPFVIPVLPCVTIRQPASADAYLALSRPTQHLSFVLPVKPFCPRWGYDRHLVYSKGTSGDQYELIC